MKARSQKPALRKQVREVMEIERSEKSELQQNRLLQNPETSISIHTKLQPLQESGRDPAGAAPTVAVKDPSGIKDLFTYMIQSQSSE